MNKVRAVKKIDLLLEGEKASRFYSKIRLAVKQDELEGKKKAIDCLYWPKNIISKQDGSESLFRKKEIKTDAKLESLDIYVVSKTKYNELREGEEKLSYTRFGNLRNYFVITRLQSLSEEEKKSIKISFAIRDTVIDRTIEYRIEKKIVEEWQKIEDGVWTYNDDKGFMTKIPAFYGPLIFIELGMFKGKEVSIKDRKTVDSKNNTDERSICTRFVVKHDEKSLYNKVAELTYSNLRKLVDDGDLLKKSKKYMRKYDLLKKGI